MRRENARPANRNACFGSQFARQKHTPTKRGPPEGIRRDELPSRQTRAFPDPIVEPLCIAFDKASALPATGAPHDAVERLELFPYKLAAGGAGHAAAAAGP